MKIITLICNFVLLGFPVMALLTGNESGCTSDIVVKFFLLLVPVLNIVVLLRSQISLNRLTFRLSDMKTQFVVFIFTFLLLSNSCSKQNTSDQDKKEALEKYFVCKQIANDWLIKLDSTNYYHISSIQSLQRKNSEEIMAYINEVQKVYGKINSRKILGSHIWSGKKLLTYAPDLENKNLTYINTVKSKDGFYVVKPKYFGFKSYRKMFSCFPKGEIVMLMYQSSPTNKSFAGELLAFWHDHHGIWQVVGYKISDNI